MTRAVRAAQQARPVPQTKPVAPISPNWTMLKKQHDCFFSWHNGI